MAIRIFDDFFMISLLFSLLAFRRGFLLGGGGFRFQRDLPVEQEDRLGVFGFSVLRLEDVGKEVVSPLRCFLKWAFNLGLFLCLTCEQANDTLPDANEQRLQNVKQDRQYQKTANSQSAVHDSSSLKMPQGVS